jgi:hypothetical protein
LILLGERNLIGECERLIFVISSEISVGFEVEFEDFAHVAVEFRVGLG